MKCGSLTETGAVAVERPRTIEAAAVDVQYPVLLCGHSHIPRQVRLADGRLIVNPGSVGLPGALGDQPVRHAIENGSPDARFAVLSRRHGQWQAAHHAVAYDHRPAARRAAERGRADWASALASGWIDTA